MTDQRIARVVKDVLYRELPGEGVALQVHFGQYYGLDPVCHRAWQLIGEMGRLDQVYNALLDEFDADPATLAADLAAFVNELEGARLIELVTEGHRS